MRISDWSSDVCSSDLLLERGVRIRFQTGPFCHSKLFVVDGAYAMIGSANWDPRSLLLNFELNVEIYDNPLAQQLATHFANAWQNAEELLQIGRASCRERVGQSV